MRRNVRDRVSALAPFLTYDSDPYIVVGNDGRLSWIMDAFTTSDSYPYTMPPLPWYDVRLVKRNHEPA